MNIAIVKYNAGNIYSVDYALKRLGVEATITADKELLMKADKVIFPGVGEAETTMDYLREQHLDALIKDLKQPVLGICLGMQIIHRYYKMRKMAEELGMEGPADEAIIDLFYNQNKGHNLLHKIEGHTSTSMPRGQEDTVKHDVDVVPGTVLHRLLGRELARGASFHHWRVENPVEELTVNAWSVDGTNTIEGIENGSNVLGVQFHPEVDDLLPEIFKFLTEE